MKLGILFSGGKDSAYAAYLAKKYNHELTCLITIVSENKDSFMFHTPSIDKTILQAKLMDIPIIIQKTKGEKEIELDDLEKAIVSAVKKYHIEGVVTGAVASVYQASRIQMICDNLKLECFNPLWQKNQIELLEELIKNKFEVIIMQVAAHPLDKNWLGKTIDKSFIEKIKTLNEKYKINPAGEGGEFETLVLNCPLFKEPLKLKNKVITGSGNSWKMEVELE